MCLKIKRAAEYLELLLDANRVLARIVVPTVVSNYQPDSANSLEMCLQLVVVLEAGRLAEFNGQSLLDIPLAESFAHEALLVSLAHVLEQLVGAEEGFMTELLVS